jgi:translation initiation factor 2 alpha subunit (eIF-2alpha)
MSTDVKTGGINQIKSTLKAIETTGINVLYVGAPRYRFISTDSSYPKAEEKIKKAQQILERTKKISFSMKGIKSAQT